MLISFQKYQNLFLQRKWGQVVPYPVHKKSQVFQYPHPIETICKKKGASFFLLQISKYWIVLVFFLYFVFQIKFSILYFCRKTNRPLPIPEMRGQNVLLPLPQGRFQVIINVSNIINITECSGNSIYHQLVTFSYIWVSFCRTGIFAILCHNFSSRAFVWPNLVNYFCLTNGTP